MRDPPASPTPGAPRDPPTPGAPRDRPSASQDPRAPEQRDRRHDPVRIRPAHEAGAPASSPRVHRRPARSATAPRHRRILLAPNLEGTIPSDIGKLAKLGALRVLPRPRRAARRATVPRRRRSIQGNQISGTFPAEACGVAAGSCNVISDSDLVAPCGSKNCCNLGDGGFCEGAPTPQPTFMPTPIPTPLPTPKPTPAPTGVTIFGESYDSETTTSLRVPSASPTPGAARDRSSVSQGPRQQPDHRPDPDRDRRAHGAGGAASSYRVPDARSGARPPLGVAGTSTTTRSTARSRPKSACSRS